MHELLVCIGYDKFCGFVQNFKSLNGLSYTVTLREQSGEVSLHFPCLSSKHRERVLYLLTSRSPENCRIVVDTTTESDNWTIQRALNGFTDN